MLCFADKIRPREWHQERWLASRDSLAIAPNLPESRMPRRCSGVTKTTGVPYRAPGSMVQAWAFPALSRAKNIGAGASTKETTTPRRMHLPSVLGILVGTAGNILLLQPPFDRNLLHWRREMVSLTSRSVGRMAPVVPHDRAVQISICWTLSRVFQTLRLHEGGTEPRSVCAQDSHWDEADDGEEHNGSNHNPNHLAFGQGLVRHGWGSMGSRAGDPRKEERVGVRGEKLAGRSPNNDGTRSLG